MKTPLPGGAGTAMLKHLEQNTDRHGNVRVYFRRGHGPRTRIRETPGTDEFMGVYRALLDGRPVQKTAAKPGSLRMLVEQYYAAPEYRRLADRTRYVRRMILDGICELRTAEGVVCGTVPLATVKTRHVRIIRDGKRDFPEAANARVKALRQLFAWAIEAERAEHNPARDVPYLRGKPGGFHAWTIEEVRQYEARHPLGTKARLALVLLLFSGVRRSDVVKLGPQMARGGRWHFAETKGQSRLVKEREIPILQEARDAIGATPSGHLAYLVTEFGKPFTVNGFGNWFRKRCDEAGLKHCTAHGLRKAGATIAAENGATDRQLMAIFGWTTSKQADTYTKTANRRQMADEAMHLLRRRTPSPDGDSPAPWSEGIDITGIKKPLVPRGGV